MPDIFLWFLGIDMEYITKIVTNRAQTGCIGPKKYYFLHGRWIDTNELADIYNLSPSAVRSRTCKGQPLDVPSKVILASSRKMRGAASTVETGTDWTKLCSQFLLTKSSNVWNQFHKQGTDNWKACSRCGEDRRSGEYIIHRDRKSLKSTRVCIACRSALRIERKVVVRTAA